MIGHASALPSPSSTSITTTTTTTTAANQLSLLLPQSQSQPQTTTNGVVRSQQQQQQQRQPEAQSTLRPSVQPSVQPSVVRSKTLFFAPPILNHDIFDTPPRKVSPIAPKNPTATPQITAEKEKKVISNSNGSTTPAQMTKKVEEKKLQEKSVVLQKSIKSIPPPTATSTHVVPVPTSVLHSHIPTSPKLHHAKTTTMNGSSSRDFSLLNEAATNERIGMTLADGREAEEPLEKAEFIRSLLEKLYVRHSSFVIHHFIG
jgi:hypothetical protein